MHTGEPSRLHPAGARFHRRWGEDRHVGLTVAVVIANNGLIAASSELRC